MSQQGGSSYCVRNLLDHYQVSSTDTCFEKWQIKVQSIGKLKPDNTGIFLIL